jgi:OmcA/MtrC family decaheme c-type cytochrome
LASAACTGDEGPQGAAGAEGADGTDGTDGLDCWDLDGDGEPDALEDVNNDGVVNAIDCQLQATAAETCAICHGPERATDIAVTHGLIAPPHAVQDATTLVAGTINSVAVDGGTGAVTVDVTFENQDEVAVTGIEADSIRFTIAQLIVGTNGDANYWDSYVTRTETADPVGDGDGSDETQATYQYAEDGAAFSDNGGGNYTFTFSGVTVDPASDNTHRVAIQLSDQPITTNPSYDWVPSGATGATKDVVATASCNTCHDPLAIHGGGRREIEYCVTCHNPGSTDANSDNTLDMAVMVHKIHMGRHLPSVEAGGHYRIWGYLDSIHDYSEVGFPQAPTNCTKCHDSDAATTADNHKTKPTIAACGSCHDLISFVDPAPAGMTLHSGGAQANNSLCTSCHSASDVVDHHANPAALASGDFEYNIVSVNYTAASRSLEITFSVTNPNDSDAAYDLVADPEFTQTTTGATRLAIIVGWDTADYSNVGVDGAAAQPISINPLEAGVATSNGDGTYTVSSTLPTAAYGTGVVAIEGHPAGEDPDNAGTYDIRVPVTNVFEYFSITAASPVARRTRVDIAKCDNCHGALSVHGNNRTGSIEVCVICHNPDATDIRFRPDDHTTTATSDGKKEETIDFKHMIHAIHGAAKRGEENAYVAWGFGNNEHVFGPEHVTFPGVLNRCTACHTDEEAISLPLVDVLGTTVDSDPSADTKAEASDEALANASDDANMSPTAAVCSSCHATPLAKTHMMQNGASFHARQEKILDLDD